MCGQTKVFAFNRLIKDNGDEQAGNASVAGANGQREASRDTSSEKEL
jgi:hypothetical protein